MRQLSVPRNHLAWCPSGCQVGNYAISQWARVLAFIPRPMGMSVTECWEITHFPTPLFSTDFDTGHGIKNYSLTYTPTEAQQQNIRSHNRQKQSPSTLGQPDRSFVSYLQLIDWVSGTSGPINQSINWLIDWLIDQSTNSSTNQSVSQWINQ